MSHSYGVLPLDLRNLFGEQPWQHSRKLHSLSGEDAIGWEVCRVQPLLVPKGVRPRDSRVNYDHCKGLFEGTNDHSRQLACFGSWPGPREAGAAQREGAGH